MLPACPQPAYVPCAEGQVGPGVVSESQVQRAQSLLPSRSRSRGECACGGARLVIGARGVHAPVGLEVADAPDAEPDGIPSLLHTTGVAIRFSPGWTAPGPRVRSGDEVSGARPVAPPGRGTRLLSGRGRMEIIRCGWGRRDDA